MWDYQTKACMQTLEGHAHNVSAVAFHPELPVILTGSEDGSVKIWHSTTYRLESTLNYGLERLWALGCCKGSNQCAHAPSRAPCGQAAPPAVCLGARLLQGLQSLRARSSLSRPPVPQPHLLLCVCSLYGLSQKAFLVGAARPGPHLPGAKPSVHQWQPWLNNPMLTVQCTVNIPSNGKAVSGWVLVMSRVRL